MKTTIKKSDSGLKNRTAKVSENKPQQPQIDLQKRQFHRSLSLPRVLQLLQTQSPKFWEVSQVVGNWVWIQFEEKQPRQITAELSQLGFHWNNRRQVWQHPCGQITFSANFDPRRKYRSYFPADQKAA